MAFNPLIHPGSLLISDPFLQDPHFARTVVLICEHQPAGSFGLVVNQPMEVMLNDLVPAASDMNMPVYSGGPVAADTLHFIHKRPDLLEESVFLQKDIGWCGNFFQIIHLLRSGDLDRSEILFFLGYSGWGEGQLDQELKEKTWITSEATSPLLFQVSPGRRWQYSLNQLGGDYAQMANYPIDPQLN
jgi:putative transcriptional regulator